MLDLHVLPIGPFMLNFELVIFILSSIVAYLAVKYRLSKTGEDGRISDKFVTALVIGFLVWKFSLIIFDFVLSFNTRCHFYTSMAAIRD